MVERRRINFTGRVQGVGFRATARRCAEAHACTGWVRNDPDGSVSAEVQATPERLAAMLADLRAAMRGRIAAETISPVHPIAGEATFEIAR